MKKFLISCSDIKLIAQLPIFLIDLIAQYSENLEKIFQDLIDWLVQGGAKVCFGRMQCSVSLRKKGFN